MVYGRAFTLCLGGPWLDSQRSQTKDFKLVVGVPLFYVQHIKGSSELANLPE